MIEARIVNVDRSFEKNLGLRFGFSKALNEGFKKIFKALRRFFTSAFAS